MHTRVRLDPWTGLEIATSLKQPGRGAQRKCVRGRPTEQDLCEAREELLRGTIANILKEHGLERAPERVEIAGLAKIGERPLYSPVERFWQGSPHKGSATLRSSTFIRV